MKNVIKISMNITKYNVISISSFSDRLHKLRSDLLFKTKISKII